MKLAISSLGFSISCLWLCVNIGGKYWQGVWEQKVKELETEIIGPLYKWHPKMEAEYFLKGRRFSPSRLSIAVSLCVVVFSLAVLSYDLIEFGLSKSMPFLLFFAFFFASLVWATYSGDKK
jgi:hypothetical protein